MSFSDHVSTLLQAFLLHSYTQEKLKSSPWLYYHIKNGLYLSDFSPAIVPYCLDASASVYIAPSSQSGPLTVLTHRAPAHLHCGFTYKHNH